MNDNIKILFFGDLVGRPGRLAVRDYLAKLEDPEKPDFVIANVENASHGFGLTVKNYNDLIEYGIDGMTSGNHIFDKKELINTMDEADKLVRPINYPTGMKYGKGSRVIEKNGLKIGIINILGQVFMMPVKSPWEIIKEEVDSLKKETPIIFIDFHAEATAEKICFGKFCSQLGVSALIGTHTHIQTADECIMNNMAYITDVGFCGAKDSVIGMDYDSSLNRFITALPERYEVAESKDSQICAVEIIVNKTSGFAESIKRIYSIIRNKEKEDDNEM